ncbi:MAG: FecR family protein [Acidimicrobiia bacterium]
MLTNRPSLRLLLSAVVLASLSLACGDDGGDATLTATLRIHGGTVEVDADGAGTFSAGTEGQTLTEGATVRTGLAGRASVEWPDGSVTRLDFETSLRIVGLERGGGVLPSTVVEAEQQAGNTYSRVVDITETGSRFEIETPTASAAVQGTTYAVLVAPDGSTSIVVLEGAVLVTLPSGEEVLVEAGFTLTVAADGSFTGPTATSAEMLNSDWLVFNDDCDDSGECTTDFTAGGPSGIELVPAEATINLGESQVYSAQGLDDSGSPVGAVAASFDVDGVPCEDAVCTPTAAGDYTVTATFGDLQATGTLIVLTTGDIQVTLDWNAIVDLDLWVTDPAGETIAWDHRQSASGGSLDRDAYANCDGSDAPPENAVWSSGAPSGEYVVTVHVYDLCGLDSTGFELTVRVGGQVVLVVDDVVLAENDATHEATFTVP